MSENAGFHGNNESIKFHESHVLILSKNVLSGSIYLTGYSCMPVTVVFLHFTIIYIMYCLPSVFGVHDIEPQAEGTTHQRACCITNAVGVPLLALPIAISRVLDHSLCSLMNLY